MHEPKKNSALVTWVSQIVQLCEPETTRFCDGGDEENRALIEKMTDRGTFIRLNPAKRPNSYLCRSDPRDVARVESRTFVCTRNKNDAGPTNNWVDFDAMKT